MVVVASASVLGGPVDELSSVLIRTHEENLVLAVQINDRVLDAGADRGQEQIEDTVDVLLEGDPRLVLVVSIQENDTLGTAFGDVLVLALLGVGQIVVLIEQ